MDSRLEERLRKWHEQLEKVQKCERVCFELEASEKSFFSELFLHAEGKSIAEREARAYTQDEWIKFAKGLAQAKSDYNHERRLLELKQKSFESEYLTYKLEHDAVRRSA